MKSARREAQVTVSLALSCGCTTRPSKPLPWIEVTHPGVGLICDRHDEYAVIVRVTQRLVYDRDTLAALLAEAHDLDADTALSIADEQTTKEK